jgi:hypothetical protein
MKRLTSKSLFGILVLGLMLFAGMSTDAMAQGRGRGRGLDKKCEKFVNCHDARDGRWDGRGPNRNDDRFGNIFRRSRRHHDRDRDRDRWERRRRNRDRDWNRRWR